MLQPSAGSRLPGTGRPPAPAGGRSVERPRPAGGRDRWRPSGRSHRASGQLRHVAPVPCRPARQGQQSPRLLRCGHRGRARWGGGAAEPGRAPRAGAQCGPRGARARLQERLWAGPGRRAQDVGGPWAGPGERTAPAVGGGGCPVANRPPPSERTGPRTWRERQHGSTGTRPGAPGAMPGVGPAFPWQRALRGLGSRRCPRVRPLPRRSPRAAPCRARPHPELPPGSHPWAPPWPRSCRSTASLAGGGGARGKLGETAALVLLAAPVLPEVTQKFGQTVKIEIRKQQQVSRGTT